MRRSLNLRHTLGNVYAVARREYTWRASTRTFIVTTIVLLIAAVGLAMAPTIISYFDRNESQKVGVYTGGADPHGDPVVTLDALLNAQARIGSDDADTGGAGAGATADKDFSISAKGDYLLPVPLVMPGDWEFRFTFVKDEKTVFRGAYLFDL